MNYTRICLILCITVQLQALQVRKLFIDQNQFKGPCGCIALICAARQQSNKLETVTDRAIERARKAKKDLTNSEILKTIAVQAQLSLHVIRLIRDQPAALGYIAYQASTSVDQAYIKKLKQIIINFKKSKNRYLHFVCCIKTPVNHGFLITIDKVKDVLIWCEDVLTPNNQRDVDMYVNVLKKWYEQG